MPEVFPETDSTISSIAFPVLSITFRAVVATVSEAFASPLRTDPRVPLFFVEVRRDEVLREVPAVRFFEVAVDAFFDAGARRVLVDDFREVAAPVARFLRVAAAFFAPMLRLTEVLRAAALRFTAPFFAARLRLAAVFLAVALRFTAPFFAPRLRFADVLRAEALRFTAPAFAPTLRRVVELPDDLRDALFVERDPVDEARVPRFAADFRADVLLPALREVLRFVVAILSSIPACAGNWSLLCNVVTIPHACQRRSPEDPGAAGVA